LNPVGDHIALSTLWSSKTSFLNFSFNMPGKDPVHDSKKVSFFVAHEEHIKKIKSILPRLVFILAILANL